MLLMPPKKQNKPGPKPGHPATQAGFRLNSALMAALEVLCERNRRTKTAEIEMALEKHLAEAGLWPPTPPAK